jgi:hypothetical protein
MQTCGVECPGVAAVATDAEAFSARDEHDFRTARVREHLVNVLLDVDRRRPRHSAVARAHDTADVHVDVNRAISRDRDRANVRGIAPRRVPRLATFDGLERLHARETGATQSKQVRLLRADQHAVARGADARRRGAVERGARRPAIAVRFPQR